MLLQLDTEGPLKAHMLNVWSQLTLLLELWQP